MAKTFSYPRLIIEEYHERGCLLVTVEYEDETYTGIIELINQ